MKPTDSIVDNSWEGVQSVEHRRLSTRGLAVRSLETTPLLDARDERPACTDSTVRALGRCGGETWFTVHSTSATGKCYQLPHHWHSPIACRYDGQPSGDRIAGEGSGMATARGRKTLLSNWFSSVNLYRRPSQLSHASNKPKLPRSASKAVQKSPARDDQFYMRLRYEISIFRRQNRKTGNSNFSTIKFRIEAVVWQQCSAVRAPIKHFISEPCLSKEHFWLAV